MKRQERYNGLIEWFSKNNPNPESELVFTDSYQLIIAVILSAQCTDKRVNMITPALFDKYPTVYHLAKATPEDVFDYIKSVTYPNNKSKHLVGMAKKLVTDFDGKVPSDVSDLVKLPGVGRKTANVVASVYFDVPAIAVDTHVYRVSRRVGLVPYTANTPAKVEAVLNKHFPKVLWSKAHHWLILHGRYVCTARSPKCNECGISSYCRYFSKKNKV